MIGGQLLHPVGEETSIGILAFGKGLKSVYHDGEISFNFRRFKTERAHYFDMFIPGRGFMKDVRIINETFEDLTESEMSFLINGPLKEYQLEYCIIRPLIMNPLLLDTLGDLHKNEQINVFKDEIMKANVMFENSNRSFTSLMELSENLSKEYHSLLSPYMHLP